MSVSKAGAGNSVPQTARTVVLRAHPTPYKQAFASRCPACRVRARGQLSSGVVKGSNAQARLTCKKAPGFRTCHGAATALYHALGASPEPEFTHRFC